MTERKSRQLTDEEEQRYAPKILQIIPATGWEAVYAMHDAVSGVTVASEPLVAWALITCPIHPTRKYSRTEPVESFAWGRQTIVGMVAGDMFGITPVIETHNFIGYRAPGEDLSNFREQAEEYHQENGGEAKTGGA